MDNLVIMKGWCLVGLGKGQNNAGGALLGEGSLELTQGALGSTWYYSIKNLLQGIWTDNQVKYMVGESGLNLIRECHKKAIEQRKNDLACLYSFEE